MSQKKKQADNKKEYAFRLFIGGETQKVIAKTIGVTEAHCKSLGSGGTVAG